MPVMKLFIPYLTQIKGKSTKHSVAEIELGRFELQAALDMKKLNTEQEIAKKDSEHAARAQENWIPDAPG